MAVAAASMAVEVAEVAPGITAVAAVVVAGLSVGAMAEEVHG